MEWNLQPFSNHPNAGPISKPKKLKELIEVSKKLAAGFALVRVDFYILDEGSIKFGELTFTPTSGLIWWNMPERDSTFGQMVVLPGESGNV